MGNLPNLLYILTNVMKAADSFNPEVVKAKWEKLDFIDTINGKGYIGGTSLTESNTTRLATLPLPESPGRQSGVGPMGRDRGYSLAAFGLHTPGPTEWFPGGAREANKRI